MKGLLYIRCHVHQTGAPFKCRLARPPTKGCPSNFKLTNDCCLICHVGVLLIKQSRWAQSPFLSNYSFFLSMFEELGTRYCEIKQWSVLKWRFKICCSGLESVLSRSTSYAACTWTYSNTGHHKGSRKRPNILSNAEFHEYYTWNISHVSDNELLRPPRGL